MSASMMKSVIGEGYRPTVSVMNVRKSVKSRPYMLCVSLNYFRNGKALPVDHDMNPLFPLPYFKKEGGRLAISLSSIQTPLVSRGDSHANLTV